MGGFDLAQYVNEQIKKGYTAEQVTSYLVRYGYNQQDINKAIVKSQKKPLFSGLFGKKTPANPQLVNYVRSYMAQGYNADMVSNYLRNNRYPEDQIKAAIKEAKKGQPHVKHEIDISTKTFVMLAIFLIVFGAGGGGVYYVLTMDKPPRLMDYELVIKEKEVYPGDDVSFSNNFVNMGDKRAYDIIIDYKIIDINSGKEIESKRETIGISTTVQKDQTLRVPNDAKPGRHRLEGNVRYGSDIASSLDNFIVLDSPINPAEPSCIDGIKNQDETGIDCGGGCKPCQSTPVETCNDGLRNQDEIGVDCGGVCRSCQSTPVETCFDGKRNQNEEETDCGGVCKACGDEPTIKPDNKEILKKVLNMGAANEEESLRLCNSIDEERYADDCFLWIAETFDDSAYCEKIVSDSDSNICYMKFFNKGDYTVCEKIRDVHVKRSCELYRNVQDLMDKQENPLPVNDSIIT